MVFFPWFRHPLRTISSTDPCTTSVQVIVAVVTHFRCQQVAFHPYLDDFIYQSLSRERALKDLQFDSPMPQHDGFPYQQRPVSYSEPRTSGVSSRHKEIHSDPLSGQTAVTISGPFQSQGYHSVGCPELTRFQRLIVTCHDTVVWSHFRLWLLQCHIHPDLLLVEWKTHLWIPLSKDFKNSLFWWLTLNRLSQGMSMAVPVHWILTMPCCWAEEPI